jgi:hypothetical protein
LASDIFPELRQLVRDRAKNRCEYCLLPQFVTLHKHEPDHIVPRQHDGKTEAENLALACMRCNRYKGPNVGSFDPLTGDLVPFFNPRRQNWTDHFEIRDAMIYPLTAEARVTVKILRINDTERMAERAELLSAGLYE